MKLDDKLVFKRLHIVERLNVEKNKSMYMYIYVNFKELLKIVQSGTDVHPIFCVSQLISN